MDAEKLKSRIREALGAAGIPREVSEQVDGIIDSVASKKDEASAVRSELRARPPAALPPDEDNEDNEDSDDKADAAPRTASAKMTTKPARKTTKLSRKKK